MSESTIYRTNAVRGTATFFASAVESAKGAARTARLSMKRIAPHSVLREFLEKRVRQIFLLREDRESGLKFRERLAL